MTDLKSIRDAVHTIREHSTSCPACQAESFFRNTEGVRFFAVDVKYEANLCDIHRASKDKLMAWEIRE